MNNFYKRFSFCHTAPFPHSGMFRVSLKRTGAGGHKKNSYEKNIFNSWCVHPGTIIPASHNRTGFHCNRGHHRFISRGSDEGCQTGLDVDGI